MKSNLRINLWSLKRSGAHGVMMWLEAMLKDPEIKNNVNPLTVYDDPEVNKGHWLIGFEDKGLRAVDPKGVHLVVLRDPYNLVASRYKPLINRYGKKEADKMLKVKGPGNTPVVQELCPRPAWPRRSTARRSSR